MIKFAILIFKGRPGGEMSPCISVNDVVKRNYHMLTKTGANSLQCSEIVFDT